MKNQLVMKIVIELVGLSEKDYPTAKVELIEFCSDKPELKKLFGLLFQMIEEKEMKKCRSQRQKVSHLTQSNLNA